MSKKDQSKKPKKSLKRRILFWSFGVILPFIIVAGAGVVTFLLYEADHVKLRKALVYRKQTLTRAARALTSAARRPQSRALILDCGEHEYFKDLVNALNARGLVSSDENANAEVLGTKTISDPPYDLVHRSLGPNNARDLLKLLDWKPGDNEPKVAVLFTLDEEHITRNMENHWFPSWTKIPVVFAGEREALTLTLEEIEERCLRIDGKVVNLQDKPISELYGSYPFHYVSPK